MARKPLEWSARAATDLARIETYYASEASPLVAQEASSAIFSAVERLAESPETYRAGAKNTREYVMRRFPYTIVFRIDARKIRIVRVMHQARQYFNR